MKPVTIAIIPVVASALIATSALAQTVTPNAASAPVRGPAPYGAAPAQSRVQQWYSDTGWQPGNSAVQSYGYGYGYGGAGNPPHAVIAPGPEPLQQAQPRSFQPTVTRSMPFGYVVDGFGRYPWQRAGYDQTAVQQAMQPEAQTHYSSRAHHGHHANHSGQCPHHPQTPAPALPQPPDNGYFAVSPAVPVSSTEVPYRQEAGERG